MQPFDAQLVVDLMFEFYNTLFKFPFFLPSSSLILPPHQYSEQVIQKYAPDMDPVVLDLVKRLPYLRNTYITGGQDIGPGMQSFDLRGHGISYAQDPLDLNDHGLKEEAGLYVEPWSVTLTDGTYGRYMVLNTRIGTITEVDWEGNDGQPEGSPPYYYNQHPAYPAEDVLRKWINRYMTLEWIPWDGHVLKGDDLDKEEKEDYRRVKDIYLKYGWPDNVRQEELKGALEAYKLQKLEKWQAEQDRVRLNAEQQQPINHGEL